MVLGASPAGGGGNRLASSRRRGSIDRIYVGLAFSFGVLFATRILPLPFLYDDTELWLGVSKADLGSILGCFVPGGGDLFLTEMFYRPMVMLSWWIDGFLWGDHVPGYRLTNILYYLIAAHMMFLLCRTLTGNTSTAMLCGLVFALHPVHVEALTWVSARGDIISFCFMAGALFNHVSGPPSPRNTALTCLIFALALLSKESAIVLPVWVAASDVMLLGRRRWRSWAMLGLIAILYLNLRIWFFGGLGGYRSTGVATHWNLVTDVSLFIKRLLIEPLTQAWVPWPGLYEAAERYQFLRWTLVLIVGVILLRLLFTPWLGLKRDPRVFGYRGTRGSGSISEPLYCNERVGLGLEVPKNPLTWLWLRVRLLLWSVVILVSGYAPGAVLSVGDMVNSRLLYGGVAGVCFCLAIGLSCLPRFFRVCFVVVWGTFFSFSLQPWERVGDLLLRVPNQARELYGPLDSSSEMLFLNRDFAFFQGARLFLPSSGAFSQAFHLAFGGEVPRCQWQHSNAGESFTMAYWKQNEQRLGETLYLCEWRFDQDRLVDMTEEVAELLSRTPVVVEQVSVWNAAEMEANLVDQGGVDGFIRADGGLRFRVRNADCWLSFKGPGRATHTIEIDWSSDVEAGTALRLCLYWVTDVDPVWDKNKRTDIRLTSAGKPIKTTLDIPYGLRDLAQPEMKLTGFRIDPGGVSGQRVTIHEITFR